MQKYEILTKSPFISSVFLIFVMIWIMVTDCFPWIVDGDMGEKWNKGREILPLNIGTLPIYLVILKATCVS